MSNETEGGAQIADTGDYDEIVCPECCKKGNPPYSEGEWIPVEEIVETQP